GVQVGEIGRAAGRDRRQELRVEVAPGERLLPHLEARKPPLELGDAPLLDGLDGLRLDLGMPDLKLTDLLAEHRRPATEECQAGGCRRRPREELPAGEPRSQGAGPRAADLILHALNSGVSAGLVARSAGWALSGKSRPNLPRRPQRAKTRGGPEVGGRARPNY